MHRHHVHHVACNRLPGFGVLCGIGLSVAEKSKIINDVWRRERDSNPRDDSSPTHFPGVRLRPLGHLSVGRKIAWPARHMQAVAWPRTRRMMFRLSVVRVPAVVLADDLRSGSGPIDRAHSVRPRHVPEPGHPVTDPGALVVRASAGEGDGRGDRCPHDGHACDRISAGPAKPPGRAGARRNRHGVVRCRSCARRAGSAAGTAGRARIRVSARSAQRVHAERHAAGPFARAGATAPSAVTGTSRSSAIGEPARAEPGARRSVSIGTTVERTVSRCAAIPMSVLRDAGVFPPFRRTPRTLSRRVR